MKAGDRRQETVGSAPETLTLTLSSIADEGFSTGY
jgi:hypothetical protein